ncbi:hypothetical protein TCDM_09162 [Trypanosoma cruzi Dm28c]|uniref:Uncharacterized protein n=1 Tax=Trypanosoma cruzi Dm28c TaxID=1416333 RepID=V5B670_TRYCR|nr:hypothetical protein TCDM_09162 [Trypanosoma cruzi Dm28c]
MHSGPSFRSDWWQTQASSRTCWSPCCMRDSDRRCWARQPPQTVVNPLSDVTAQHSLAAQLSRQILCHPSLHGVAATGRCPSGQHRCSVQADGWFHRGKLTPPQFIRAGAFMCRHIHREGNGGPFVFPCTAGSTVATCVHRTGHMAHSTQLTIPAMHAHIKATESVILILSLCNGSRTLLPRTPHTYTHDSSACPTQRSHRRCITPAGRVTRRARSLSSPSLHAHGGSSSHPQPPAHATKEAFKSTAMCILHVVVCACRHTNQRRSKNRSRACEGTHKQNCTAEVHGGNKEKKTAQAHNIALRKKQRPFIKN